MDYSLFTDNLAALAIRNIIIATRAIQRITN